MSAAAETAVAVLAGLAAACSFGVGAALQHRQVQVTPLTGQAPFLLLAHLARRGLWLAGLAFTGAAYGLQALALAFGPLALVAPVAATDLLFAIPIAARWSRRRMRARDWAGCALTAGGVAVFLAASPPSSGRADVSAQGWTLAFTIVVLGGGAAVTAGLLSGGRVQAGLFSVAAGAVFGLTAALTLSLTRMLRQQGDAMMIGHWQVWALLVFGVIGVLLSASAFKAGPLSASLPVIDSVEPVSAVLIGTLVFGERLAASPAGLALQFVGAAAALAGIIVLGRSPLAARASSHGAVRGRSAADEADRRPAPRSLEHDAAIPARPRTPGLGRSSAETARPSQR